MSHRWWLVVAALVVAVKLAPCSHLVADPSTAFQSTVPRLDHDGNPLPDGAILRIGTTRIRPSGAAVLLAFTADNGKLVSIDVGTGVHVWDAALGKELRGFGRLPLREAPFAVSADGGLAALVESTDICRVYDTATGKEIHGIRGPWGKARAVAVSPDNKLVAGAGEDLGVRVWEVAGGTLVRSWPHANDADWRTLRLAFSPDSKALAIGSSANPIEVLDIASGKQRSIGKKEGADGSLVFSPSGKLLAALPRDGRHFTLWDVATAKPIHDFPLERGPYWCVAFTPDGKSVVTGNYSCKICFWSLATGQLERTLTGHQGEVGNLAISADGKQLAIGSGGCTVRIWDLASAKERHVFAGPHAALTEARFSPDGKTILSLANPWFHFKSAEGSVFRMWDADHGTALREIDWNPMNVSAAGVSANGRILAVAGKNATLRVQNLVSGKDVPAIKAPPGTINGLHLSDDGRYLAAELTENAEINMVARGMPPPPPHSFQVWDVETGMPVLAGLTKNEQRPTCRFTDDGRCLAVFAYTQIFGEERDGHEPAIGRPLSTLTIWSIQTGHKLMRGGPPFLVEDFGAFSSSGRVMASLGNQGENLVIRELATGTIVLNHSLGGKLCSLAFSADGQTVAAGTNEGNILLWDVAMQKTLVRLQGHRGPIVSLSFSHNGKRLLSGADDTTMLVWDVALWTARAAKDPSPLDPMSAEMLWDDLANDDASKAHSAVMRMVKSPNAAVAVLRRQLRPVQPAETKEVAQWIADLDSQRYADREQAMAKLQKLGNLAIPALDRVLAGNPPLEVRRRAELLLSRMENQPLPRDWLQALRALEVLELVGTEDAITLLEALAGGASETWLTQEAEASLERLRKRRVKP